MKMVPHFISTRGIIIVQQILIEGVVVCDLYARIARPSRARRDAIRRNFTLSARRTRRAHRVTAGGRTTPPSVQWGVRGHAALLGE